MFGGGDGPSLSFGKASGHNASTPFKSPTFGSSQGGGGQNPSVGFSFGVKASKLGAEDMNQSQKARTKSSGEKGFGAYESQAFLPASSTKGGIFSRLTPSGDKANQAKGFTFGTNSSKEDKHTFGNDGKKAEGEEGLKRTGRMLRGDEPSAPKFGMAKTLDDEDALKMAAIANIPKFGGAEQGSGFKSKAKDKRKKAEGTSAPQEEVFDEEAMKRAAIANIPRFGGGGDKGAEVPSKGQGSKTPKKAKA